MKSEQINELAAALSKAQAAYKPVIKNKTVSVKTKQGYTYFYNYAPLEDIISATREALAANGLAVSQLLDECEAGTVLETLLIHSSGQWISSYRNLGNYNEPQSFGGQLTYYRRYALASILGVSSEDDDDTNSVSDKNAKIENKSTPTNGTTSAKNGKSSHPKRPWEAEYLCKYLRKQVEGLGKSNQATQNQIKAVVSSINSLLSGDAIDTRRQMIMHYLFDAESANDLTSAQASKLIEWTGCKKENDYQPDFDSVKEAELILDAVEFCQKGQKVHG